MLWIYSLLCLVLFLYSIKSEIEEDEEILEKFLSCYDVFGLFLYIFLFVFFLFLFIIFLVFMVVVYGKVVSVLWSCVCRKVINKYMEKIKMLVVKMMVVIVFIYFVMWGFKFIMKIMEVFYFEEDIFERGDLSEDEEENNFLMFVLEVIVEVLLLVSLVLNFLIFGYYNGSFRCEMKNIFLGLNRVKCFKKCS